MIEVEPGITQITPEHKYNSKRDDKKLLKLRPTIIADNNELKELKEYLKEKLSFKVEPLRLAKRRKPVFGIENSEELSQPKYTKYRKANSRIIYNVNRKVKRAMNSTDYVRRKKEIEEDPYMLRKKLRTPVNTSEQKSVSGSINSKLTLSQYIRRIIEDAIKKERAKSAFSEVRVVTDLDVNARFPKVFISRRLVDKYVNSHRLGKNAKGRRLKNSLGQYSFDQLTKKQQSLKDEFKRYARELRRSKRVNSIRCKLSRAKLNRQITNELKLRHHCKGLMGEMKAKYGDNLIRSEILSRDITNPKETLTNSNIDKEENKHCKIRFSRNIRELFIKNDKARKPSELEVKPLCQFPSELDTNDSLSTLLSKVMDVDKKLLDVMRKCNLVSAISYLQVKIDKALVDRLVYY